MSEIEQGLILYQLQKKSRATRQLNEGDGFWKWGRDLAMYLRCCSDVGCGLLKPAFTTPLRLAGWIDRFVSVAADSPG